MGEINNNCGCGIMTMKRYFRARKLVRTLEKYGFAVDTENTVYSDVGNRQIRIGKISLSSHETENRYPTFKPRPDFTQVSYGPLTKGVIELEWRIRQAMDISEILNRYWKIKDGQRDTFKPKPIDLDRTTATMLGMPIDGEESKA